VQLPDTEISTDNAASSPTTTPLRQHPTLQHHLQLQFSQNAVRRGGPSVGTSRVGRHLPGGGINIAASLLQAADGSAGRGRLVWACLVAMPNTLMKLNTVKRDTCTIDKLCDCAKACEKKTLEGEEAHDFYDCFDTKPKVQTWQRRALCHPHPTWV
jgi:protein SPT2